MNKFTFISRVFKQLQPDELPIVVNADKGWRAQYPTLSIDASPPAAMYFSVAAHKVTEGVTPKRGKAFFSSAHIFVLDDIGTKCAEPPVEPSYILETSKNNFQYGYLLTPFPYPTQFEACMRALASAGFTDGGSIDPVHLFRLPGSLHATGFQAVMHAHNFRRRRQLKAWMAAFGLPMPNIAEVPSMTKGRPVTQKEVEGDHFYAFLLDQGYVMEPMNDAGWVSILCPWHDRHTHSAGESWAYARYKPGSKVYCCFHEGCSKRTSTDFYSWLSAERRHVKTKQKSFAG